MALGGFGTYFSLLVSISLVCGALTKSANIQPLGLMENRGLQHNSDVAYLRDPERIRHLTVTYTFPSAPSWKVSSSS